MGAIKPPGDEDWGQHQACARKLAEKNIKLSSGQRPQYRDLKMYSCGLCENEF